MRYALVLFLALLVGGPLDASPRICELAAAGESLIDEDGDRPDWIELCNPGSTTAHLAAWSLTDDPGVPDKWILPAVSIGPGDSLVIFASGKDRRDPSSALHTNFQLNSSGETLLLVDPDRVVASGVQFPRQVAGVSYGLSELAEEILLTRESPGAYLVPTGPTPSDWQNPSFDDSSWPDATGGIGFDVGAEVDPGELEEIARTGTATQSSDYNANFGAVRAIDGNFGNFTATASADQDAYWELDLGEEKHLARLVIHNRGDGCCQSRLRDITVTLRDENGEEVYESALINPENVLGGGTTAGPERLDIDWIDDGFGAIPARYVRIRRTGDPDLSGTNGTGNNDERNILSIGEVELFEGEPGFGSRIRTDVESEMRGANSSLYCRFPFDLTAPEDFESLRATFEYDDGFVAFLNGVEVARVNAPVGLPFDASAPAAQSIPFAPSVVELSLTEWISELREGDNVLAIHGLNVSAEDDDFLIAVDVRARRSGEQVFRYLEPPTPGEPNDSNGYDGLVQDTTFSVDRGVFSEPFELEILTATEGALIRYTRDGSKPSPGQGELYDGPLRIDETLTIRAIAYRPAYRPSDVDTQSYVFPSDVVDQATMIRDIAGSASLRPLVIESLGRIPSVHITVGSSIPTSTEVPATIEFSRPDGHKGFHVEAGIKRVGGHSLGAYPKNNMRIYFRREFGAPKLRYPLFRDVRYGEGAVDEFDRLQLRSGSHDSIFYLGARAQLPADAQYVRNRFMNDLQLEMGRLSIRGRYVHVYLNGTYWGHYQLMESPGAGHIAEYEGGDKADYEAVRRGNPIGSSAPAWAALRNIRTDWSEVTRRVDVPNFVDYMLLNYWAGNAWDWRTHQNWAATGASDPEVGKYQFLCWDSDIVLRRTDDNNLGIGGPDNLFRDLLRHDEFRIALADGIERHFYGNGLLTPARVAEIYQRRAEEVRPTLIAESARWRAGGIRWLPTQQWQFELNRLLTDFFPRRAAIVLTQMRNARWFLDIATPAFRIDGTAHFGGWVPRSAELSMEGEGVILFTTDGSDPRGQDAAPYRNPVVIERSTRVLARSSEGRDWSAARDATFAVDEGLRITEIMYHPLAPEEDSIFSSGDLDKLE
ncbi:MAG: CotH kinase family protein, partial [Planctomycetota bacterium]